MVKGRCRILANDVLHQRSSTGEALSSARRSDETTAGRRARRVDSLLFPLSTPTGDDLDPPLAGSKERSTLRENQFRWSDRLGRALPLRVGGGSLDLGPRTSVCKFRGRN